MVMFLIGTKTSLGFISGTIIIGTFRRLTSSSAITKTYSLVLTQNSLFSHSLSLFLSLSHTLLGKQGTQVTVRDLKQRGKFLDKKAAIRLDQTIAVKILAQICIPLSSS